MKSELVPTRGGDAIPLTRDLTVIGRREFCDVVIDDVSLSKRHCVLIRTDGLLIVRDLATTNGTKVNGQRVAWAALLPNDRITLGRAKYKVYLGPDDAPSPSERLSGLFPAIPEREPDASPHAPLSLPHLAALTSEPSPPRNGRTGSGSTDPDAETLKPEILEAEVLDIDEDDLLDEFVMDDEDEPFLLDL